MKKAMILLGALVLLGPSLPLITIAALAMPATKTTCAYTGGLSVGPIPESLTVTLADGTSTVLDRTQLTHAATIITVGSRTEGIDRDGVIIALMAGLTESQLRMLANTAVYPESGDYPNDGDASDHDSLGIFQMRPQAGWGTVEDLMDPVYQARAFYGGPTGPNYPSPRGLLDIPDWKQLDKGAAAQAVEVSQYPDRYDNWQPAAEQILATLTTPSGTSGGTPGQVPETSSVVFPLPAGTWVRTSQFGWRTHPITGIRKLHAGVDLAAADGTAIFATADGVVSFSGPASGYGNLITINHTVQGQAVTSAYGHMWAGHLYVNTGDTVTAGQHIADVGSAGDSTGAHLHFEIRPNGDQSAVIDPEPWLADNGATDLGQPVTNTNGCYLPGGAA
jgi:murein DD-endopeptidase MepM/ murein hydrolase activator NlpD